jgi:HAD superfamily hydrolase (TIGR01509 family)
LNKNNSRLNGVLIDFGGTLAHLDKQQNRNYVNDLLSTVGRNGYQRGVDQVDSALSASLGGSTKGEFASIAEFWKDFLRNLRIDGTSAQCIRELEEVRSHYSGTLFKLYDGASKVLSTLQEQYHLALVSNCAIGTGDVIDALGIADYFEALILSYEVGSRKPERRIYLEALQRLELEPHECIFVADEVSDLEGAREVGFRTMLVRQGSLTLHEAKDRHFKADLECQHIAEITGFLY